MTASTDGAVPAMPRSALWSIEDLGINASLMTLSSSANAEFDKLLASGFLINAKSYSTLQSSLTASNENRINFF